MDSCLEGARGPYTIIYKCHPKSKHTCFVHIQHPVFETARAVTLNNKLLVRCLYSFQLYLRLL